MVGQQRVLGAQMEVYAAYADIKKAQKEAERERRPVPAIVGDRLRSALQLAQGNLEQAEAAYEAARRYPPLRFS